MAVRPRRSLVALAGGPTASEKPARALTEWLSEIGIDARYLGRFDNPRRLATEVVEGKTDAVELCLARDSGGVVLLRTLLRELVALGRGDVSIVVHRVE